MKEEQNQIKLFKLNDSDWVAAHDLDEAKLCLSKTVSDGIVNEAFEDEFINEPYEVSEEDMNKLKLTDEDDWYDFTSKNSDKFTDREEMWKAYMETCLTFKEALAKQIKEGRKFPCHFAASEY